MFAKVFILCAASASFLYSAMYAVVSSFYHKHNGHSTGLSNENLFIKE